MAKTTKANRDAATVNFWMKLPGGEVLQVETAKKEALQLQHRAVKEGRRVRVDTNSMADFFEDHRDLDAARLEALDVIRQTPDLDWMILTRRPEKIQELLERAWEDAITSALSGWLYCWKQPTGDNPPNVWIGTTVENQEWANKRIPALLRVPAAVRFLSMEPLLGQVELRSFLPPMGGPGWMSKYRPVNYDGKPLIHWIIVGGESDHQVRPLHPDWVRNIRDQCATAGVPFLFKGWGEWVAVEPEEGEAFCCVCGCTENRACRGGCYWIDSDEMEDRCSQCEGLEKPEDRPLQFFEVGRAAAGRLLDDVLHDGYPTTTPLPRLRPNNARSEVRVTGKFRNEHTPTPEEPIPLEV